MAPTFEIHARDPGSRARAGTLHLAHGDVATPAFVPLATRGAVKTLGPRDVEALGYELVLGNTFHLFLSPGLERMRRLGGLNEFMRWPRPIITDSGGFQIFSMGHGGVADEIKGRRTSANGAGASNGSILAIEERGVRFRSYLDGAERFLGPEQSMEMQAAIGSDIALVLDECTPFHSGYDYTARSMERTHRWLHRCLEWHERHGPDGQGVYSIVQGGTYHDLRLQSSDAIAAAQTFGVAVGGSLGQDKAQMYEVVDWTTLELERLVPQRTRHLLGIGEVDDLINGVRAGIDTFDCAMPTRLGRHGVALVPDPGGRWRLDLDKSRHAESEEPILDGCDCPACAGGFSRAYLHYLLRAGELTGLRLITQHNLRFIAALMADLRDAIAAGRLDKVADALSAGAAPGTVAAAG
ncbi:MAG TPA: tRNA guanosine(34) transglycosylase Tgt [Solirubrobacteraceae bacterium]|nr:tRNA guanosine(34) transglycosylase Tgt [Solirubrobacteraceae bacterium]